MNVLLRSFLHGLAAAVFGMTMSFVAIPVEDTCTGTVACLAGASGNGTWMAATGNQNGKCACDGLDVCVEDPSHRCHANFTNKFDLDVNYCAKRDGDVFSGMPNGIIITTNLGCSGCGCSSGTTLTVWHVSQCGQDCDNCTGTPVSVNFLVTACGASDCGTRECPDE